MHVLLQDLCVRHRPAVLLVTHDVDEAILLADRAVVLVDGQITLDLPIDLHRPRDRGHPAFVQMRHRLLLELGVKESVAPAPSAVESRTDSAHHRTRKDQPSHDDT
jgi:sulfonate transport system ATP-binding protein